MSEQVIGQVLGYLIGGAAVYAAIRADMAFIRARTEQACKDAEKAHDRLDSHIEVHHTRGA